MSGKYQLPALPARRASKGTSLTNTVHALACATGWPLVARCSRVSDLIMGNMSDGKITINRTLVGMLAIGCLTAAAAIWIFAQTTDGEDNREMWRGAFTRV